jgi:hypothetical protein
MRAGVRLADLHKRVEMFQFLRIVYDINRSDPIATKNGVLSQQSEQIIDSTGFLNN